MLVYRERRRAAAPREVVATLRAALGGAGVSLPHDAVVSLLVELGTLEAGIADAVCPEADDRDPLLDLLREASRAAGHLLWHSWHGAAGRVAAWRDGLDRALGRLASAPLPPRVELSTPEGYADYGLYPETYLEAARRFVAAERPRAAVCVGIRSIGTSLSAAVVGALEELGCPTATHTVRPRGHPFARTIALGPGLEAALRAVGDRHFLVVDEGPGISGSSMTGAAERLSELGVPDDRIVLLPSWETDGAGLRSAVARRRWARHRRYTATFEEAWLPAGRLRELAGGRSLTDLGAGAWRRRLYPGPAHYPAVQPQHERRKYLAEPPPGDRDGGLLLRFAGLGGAAEAKRRRGEALAAAGFGPPVAGAGHGFVALRFVPGCPLEAGRAAPPLVEALARYLAHVTREHPAEPDASPAELAAMIEANVAEGLGGEWARLAAARARATEASERPAALDGRMLPHEWVRTAGGYLKCDALDHHDDHFFPGPQDAAWDVAGTCLEFDLRPAARRALVARYRVLSGDRTIAARLPFHAVAYLAFRLGYATLASEVLGADAAGDARRFAALRARYAALLRRELADRRGRAWAT